MSRTVVRMPWHDGLFNGKRLRLAREYRAMSRRDLAKALGVATPVVTAFEELRSLASDEEIEQMAKVLEFPPKFFRLEDPPEIGLYFACRTRNLR